MLSYRVPVVTGAVLLALLLPACSPQDSDGTSPTTGASGGGPSPGTASAAADAATSGVKSPACRTAAQTTKTAGTLTVGTDKPAYSPWFVDDTPTNGKGFESAVAYAVAQQLGFPSGRVRWVTASFNSVIQPGPKPFDVDINQFSITADRKKAVDFSTGYYDVTQSIVAIKGNRAAGAKTLADLKKVKFGAQVGTTSYQSIIDTIKPSKKPAVFDDNDKAKLALANGQIDALVVDLPTGLYLAGADLKHGVLVGQLSNPAGSTEQFGLVLEKGSNLTPCVSDAVDRLRADGTLKRLETTWLTDAAGAPVLH
jgi:polar amino acid transport system substrate-binding protein